MDKNKLLQIGIDFRDKKRQERTWEELNNSIGKHFATGESYRCFVKKELKKIGQLKSKDEVMTEQEKSTKEEIEKQKKELNEIKKEYDKIEKEIGRLEAQEERRLKIVESDGYYTIYSSKRQIKVTKEKVKEIKQLYCDDNGLGITELCRKVNITRRDFMLIKYAFDIVHNDVPYLDEELEGDIESLVDDTLERKKEQYFLKLKEKEIELMKSEIKQYREKDYLYNKIIDGINDITINPVKHNVKIEITKAIREALIDLADWHLGLYTKNFWNTFNKDVAKERAEKLTREVIEICAENGIRVLHVSTLGDMVSGIIHQSLIKESDLDIVDQVKLAVELIGKMLIEFSMVFDKVYYSDTVGNHGRMFKGKDEATEKENFEYFISWGIKLMLSKKEYENVIFEDNCVDEGIIIKDILGVKIFETHGHCDKFNNIAQDLTMMIEKCDEVHTAHYHSNKSLEVNGVEVFMGRSFSGTDLYSKNIRKVGKAGQRLYIYEQNKRKYIAEIEL